MYVIKLNRCIVTLTAVLTAAAVILSSFAVIRTASSETKGIKVPIIMYHSILKNSNNNKYIVSPDSFEDDLKFLKKQGYTTILMRDLTEYVYKGKKLPKKPIILTFDDGYYNNYVYIYPLLKKYNAKAVISVVGSYTDQYSDTPDENANYSYMTWDNLKELEGSGLVEIQNHTYNLHSISNGRSGCKKKSGESKEAYKELLSKDIKTLQDKCKSHLSHTPTTFTYPFGLVSSESVDVIKELGFKASLSCEEGINIVERNPEQLYMMKRYIRTPSKNAEKILRQP